jgi:hypothetical protein
MMNYLSLWQRSRFACLWNFTAAVRHPNTRISTAARSGHIIYQSAILGESVDNL